MTTMLFRYNHDILFLLLMQATNSNQNCLRVRFDVRAELPDKYVNDTEGNGRVNQA